MPRGNRITGILRHDNHAKPLRLYSMACPTNNNRQVRALSKPDGRTRAGRIERAFRQDLLDHFGTAPDIIQRELIEQCVELKVSCCVLQQKQAEGHGTDYDSKRLNAAQNSLQRCLIKLGYREKAAVDKLRAEAELTRASSRKR